MNIPTSYPVTAGDLNIYHARLIADQQITYVLEFSESLDLERLMNALDVLHRALPILSFNVKIKGSHYQRVRCPDYKPVIAIANQPADPAKEIVNFIGKPCDPERDFPLKLLLIRNKGGDTLCFKIDHILSDAAGLRCLLMLFAEAYDLGKITQSINQDRGFGQVLRRFSPIAIYRATRKESLPRPGPAIFHGSFDADCTFIEHVFLDPSRFERLHSEAKRCGATLNDYLVAALYQVLFKYVTPGYRAGYPVMVPVDMRRYLPEGQRDVIGNLSSAVYPSLTPKPSETFRDTLDRVKASMDHLKQDNPGLGAMLLMAVGSMGGGAMMHKSYEQAAAHGSRFINYTNFGVIEETSIAFDGASLKQVYGVGPIQYVPGFLITLSTYQNKLHFVVQGKGNQQFQSLIRQFLNELLGCLP